MKVSIRDRLEAVGASGWDGLVAASRLRSPFLSWAWQSEWARTFAADRRLEIRCVEDGAGNLIAVLPLFESAPGTLQLIGGPDVSDYLDLISLQGREEEAWMALLQSRTAERVEWELHAVPEISPTVAGLAPLAAACGLTASATVEERCPVLALPSSWETYLARLSGKHRHELQRKMRRLDRDAPDAHVSCVSAPADIAARLGDFLVLHRSSRVGKARFMDERMEEFFRDSTRTLAAAGWARLWFLDWNGAAVASFLCLEYGGSIGLYNSGFDPTHAKLAPGLVLLAHVIGDAITRRFPVFDFLRGEEPYKYAFGPEPQDLIRMQVRQ
jgi:CelD/BcsL family acetyltransferase involved in cellulose biosynthesis